MSSHKSRLAKLEGKQQGPRTIVVVYADKTDPAKLEALSRDESINLLVVRYVDQKPDEELNA